VLSLCCVVVLGCCCCLGVSRNSVPELSQCKHLSPKFSYSSSSYSAPASRLFPTDTTGHSRLSLSLGSVPLGSQSSRYLAPLFSPHTSHDVIPISRDSNVHAFSFDPWVIYCGVGAVNA
jgi:hypothetical protein